MKMIVDGEIKQALCRKCGEAFPVYIFIGDTDMVTAGWFAFTGVRDKDIVLAEFSQAEVAAGLDGLVGPDYKHVGISYQKQASLGALSFHEFLKLRKPPVATYECIYCGGPASETKTESRENFLSHGKISVRSGT
jgi:hypothetical protein